MEDVTPLYSTQNTTSSSARRLENYLKSSTVSSKKPATWSNMNFAIDVFLFFMGISNFKIMLIVLSEAAVRRCSSK